eukprot:jgi/Mesen1/809/ME000110S_11079
MSAVRIPVTLLGCGGVGQQLLDHILSTRQLHASQGVRLAVVAVQDSKAVVVPHGTANELTDGAIRAVIDHKRAGRGLQEFPCADLGVQLAQVWAPLREEGGAIWRDVRRGVLVDCSAEATGGELARFSRAGGCLVLANKKGITDTLEIYDGIVASPRRFRCESTVGAGLPVMATLARQLAAGDPIVRICGALSGTLGYVMSGLQEGRPLSQALIMARALGWRLHLSDLPIEALYPTAMGPEHMGLDDFLATGLRQLDASVAEKVQSAAAKGCALRYVATLQEGSCRVGLQEVPLDSPLGRLRGSDNLVEINSRCYKDAPLVIQGAGAGNDTTAAGVLADILDLQDLYRL